jgi:hypothetical protein
MKVVGILTEDPKRYFEALVALRASGIKHISLDFSDPLPANVSVIVSTEEERDRIPFDKVVTDPDPDVVVSRVRRLLAGEEEIDCLVIGIDPGSRPGIAALGDGIVLVRTIAPTPEDSVRAVGRILEGHAASRVLVRIGHGDRTNRNRIFNALWDMGLRVEIVDERNTTKRSRTPDEDAAVEIALTPGYAPRKRQSVSPAPGEVRNIQRLSRLRSHGELTVSKELAEKVASGEMSMEDAIAAQRECGTQSRTSARQ